MAQVSFTASGATTYDLTLVTVNPGAVNEATARPGGHVARNRINFANVTAPTITNKVMNVLRLLKVPPRTVVTGVYLISPRGTAGVGIGLNSKAVSSGTAGLGFSAFKDASLSSASTDTSGFGKATLSESKIHTSSILALPADPETSPKGSVRFVAAGVSGGNHGWADGADDAQIGIQYPYGGYVTFQLLAGKGPSGTSAASLDGALTGILEVAAVGFKVPE